MVIVITWAHRNCGYLHKTEHTSVPLWCQRGKVPSTLVWWPESDPQSPVLGENQLQQIVLWSPHTHHDTHASLSKWIKQTNKYTYHGSGRARELLVTAAEGKEGHFLPWCNPGKQFTLQQVIYLLHLYWPVFILAWGELMKRKRRFSRNGRGIRGGDEG